MERLVSCHFGPKAYNWLVAICWSDDPHSAWHNWLVAIAGPKTYNWLVAISVRDRVDQNFIYIVNIIVLGLLGRRRAYDGR